MIEATDAAGRVMLRAGAAYLVAMGRDAEHRGAARFYAGALYMDRPRSRLEWRAREAARHVFRAEIHFRPFFA